MRYDDPAALWRLQLGLECKGFDQRGRLIRTPGDDLDDLATCYVVSYSGGGAELAFADSAPAWFVDRARNISLGRYLSQQADFGTAVSVQRCVTYRFPEMDPLPQANSEHVSIVVDGRPVATAVSSRSNDSAAELWIHTEPGYRRRGYATQAARAWAADVTAAGKVAFYSHLYDNVASRSLARQLGVTPLFDLVGLTLEGESYADRR